MKTFIPTMILLLVPLWLLGCSSAPSSGIVTTQTPGYVPADQPAPDIKFQSYAGTPASLNAIRQPITVIVFYSPPPNDCNAVAPQVKETAERYTMSPVTIVQVSEPTGACIYAGCVQTKQYPNLPLITLCDPKGTAWQDYGRPPAGTVFLIGSGGWVNTVTTLNRIQTLYDKIDNMSYYVTQELTPSN